MTSGSVVLAVPGKDGLNRLGRTAELLWPTSGGTRSVKVTTEQRYGPRWLCTNDDTRLSGAFVTNSVHYLVIAAARSCSCHDKGISVKPPQTVNLLRFAIQRVKSLVTANMWYKHIDEETSLVPCRLVYTSRTAGNSAVVHRHVIHHSYDNIA